MAASTPAPPLAARVASSEDVSLVLGWTQALWAGGHDLARYEAYNRGLLATPWGRERHHFVVGTDGRGDIVTACKRYYLPLRYAGASTEGVGLGAVFTPEHRRRRGHAAAMIRAIMAEEAARGTRFALLYSEIGDRYYRELGFVPLRALEAAAPAAAGEALFRPARAEDGPRILAWSQPSPELPLAFARTPDYWDFVVRLTGSEVLVYERNGAPRGFMAVRKRQTELQVLAAGRDPDTDATPFWRAARALAAARDRPQATVWLPAAAAADASAAGFDVRPMAEPIPMVAPLAGDPLPAELPLWHIDHF